MSDGDKRGSPTYSKVLSLFNIMFAVNSTINVAAMVRNKQDRIDTQTATIQLIHKPRQPLYLIACLPLLLFYCLTHG